MNTDVLPLNTKPEEKGNIFPQQSINILLIEDNPGDARLIKELLRSDEKFLHELKWVSSLNEINQKKYPDIILLDLNLPETAGTETYDEVHKMFPDVPIIVQTGLNDSVTGDLTVSKGAQDYLIKGNFSGSLLVKAIKYGLERYRLLVKLRQEQLTNERERIKTEVFENAPVALYRTTKEGDFLIVNSAIVKMFGYNSKEEFFKINAKDLYENQELRDSFVEKLEREKVLLEFEQKLIKKDGSFFYTLESSRLITDEKGDSYYEGVIEDITKRKEAEDALSESLKEKEVLLKELHHRTKNNMQVISSLIALKGNLINDELVKNILKDICARIRAISLIHQKLYQSKNLSHIDLGEYISELCELLMGSHNNNQGHIVLDLQLENVKVQIDNAIQCGLIINELITNSLKYAFPGQRDGKICINLLRENSGDVMLKISDNGCGLKDTFDFDNAETLGIQLIKAITEEQLAGSVLFETTDGFSCTLIFRKL